MLSGLAMSFYIEPKAQSMKENNKPITSLRYAHGTYGPVIDNKDALLSFLIKQNYLEFVNDEEDKILFKPVQECDLSLFTKEEILCCPLLCL